MRRALDSCALIVLHTCLTNFKCTNLRRAQRASSRRCLVGTIFNRRCAGRRWRGDARGYWRPCWPRPRACARGSSITTRRQAGPPRPRPRPRRGGGAGRRRARPAARCPLRLPPTARRRAPGCRAPRAAPRRRATWRANGQSAGGRTTRQRTGTTPRRVLAATARTGIRARGSGTRPGCTPTSASRRCLTTSGRRARVPGTGMVPVPCTRALPALRAAPAAPPAPAAPERSAGRRRPAGPQAPRAGRRAIRAESDWRG